MTKFKTDKTDVPIFINIWTRWTAAFWNGIFG